MAEVVTLSDPRDTGRLAQTSYGNTATEEAANSPENHHIDKFPTSTTRGKRGETHHWEAGGEASGGCVSVWHKASVFPGL